MLEKLKVYQKAISLAQEISVITETFPERDYYLANQLNRACLSISTNIAEGNGRQHKKERKQFFWIARASAQECLPILELCKSKDLISDTTHQKLKTKLEEICKMLSGLISGLDQNRK